MALTEGNRVELKGWYIPDIKKEVIALACRAAQRNDKRRLVEEGGRRPESLVSGGVSEIKNETGSAFTA